MELRSVGLHEVDLIEILFRATYGRKQGLEYWKWTFQNPYGFINVGMFDENNLVGYHTAQFSSNSAYTQSAMTHPHYRKEGIYAKITRDLYGRISFFRDYVTLFSNETIRPIRLGKEDYIEAYQVKEYRIPIEKQQISVFKCLLDDFSSNYDIWRYKNHPLNSYYYDYNAIFSLFEDRIQIIDYPTLRDLDEASLERIIELAKYLGYTEGKKFVSFWSEIELDYPFVLLPLWKHYKILNPSKITMEEILRKDKNRMGQSDVY